jgi:hypothetical protein
MTLKKDLIATGGDVMRSAHRVAMSRNQVYALIKRWGLWPVVNKARRQRAEKLEVKGDDLLQRTQLSMRG